MFKVVDEPDLDVHEYTIFRIWHEFTGLNYLQMDSVFKVTCCGTVQEWRFYSGQSGTIRLQVWRQSSTSYELIGENVYIVSTGKNPIVAIVSVFFMIVPR